MTSSENRFELLQDILKRTEDLLTIAGGRPLLQALHFGGVTRLSRRISHFLRHGAIHCERVSHTFRALVKGQGRRNILG